MERRPRKRPQLPLRAVLRRRLASTEGRARREDPAAGVGTAVRTGAGRERNLDRLFGRRLPGPVRRLAVPDRAAHDLAPARADGDRPAAHPPGRSPRRAGDGEHRHRHQEPPHPLGDRRREDPRAAARKGDRQAPPRRAGGGERRGAGRARAEPQRHQRRSGQAAQLRRARGAALRAGLPPLLLGRRGRGDQLPPLLRHQRSGRHPHRGAEGAGDGAREGLSALARGEGHRPADRSRRRPPRPPPLPGGSAAPARRHTRPRGAAWGPTGLRGGGEDPDWRRGAPARMADPWDDWLRAAQRRQRSLRRRPRSAPPRARLPPAPRGERDLRRSPLPRQEADPADRDVERAARSRPPPRPALRAAPLVARLHGQQPPPGAGGGDRLLPRLPHLRAGRQPLSQRRRSAARPAGRPRGEATQPHHQRIDLRLPLRPLAAAGSRGALGGGARRSARSGDAPATADRSGDGQGARGHRLLSLLPARLAERGRRPADLRDHRARTLSRLLRASFRAVAARAVGHRHPRHQAGRGHPGPPRRPLRDSRASGWRPSGAGSG